MSEISGELLKGSVEMVLLALLEQEPMYGYQMVKEARGRSNEVIHLKEGSLYPALHRLERAGLIEGFWQPRDDEANRRYYRLTAQGAEALNAKRAEWSRFTTAIEGVIRYA